MLDIKQFSSDLIDSYLDILTLDEKLLVFKEIKIIFTRYDFDLLFPVGGLLAEVAKININDIISWYYINFWPDRKFVNYEISCFVT
jgi:hypothetical protein